MVRSPFLLTSARNRRWGNLGRAPWSQLVRSGAGAQLDSEHSTAEDALTLNPKATLRGQREESTVPHEIPVIAKMLASRKHLHQDHNGP